MDLKVHRVHRSIGARDILVRYMECASPGARHVRGIWDVQVLG